MQAARVLVPIHGRRAGVLWGQIRAGWSRQELRDAEAERVPRHRMRRVCGHSFVSERSAVSLGQQDADVGSPTRSHDVLNPGDHSILAGMELVEREVMRRIPVGCRRMRLLGTSHQYLGCAMGYDTLRSTLMPPRHTTRA